MLKKILIIIILFLIVYIPITNNYIYNSNSINLSPLIIDNKQISKKANRIEINKFNINIIQGKLNNRIKDFSVEKITESKQNYVYLVCSSHAGKGGVIKLNKVDLQNFFFSNIRNDKKLKKVLEQALDIKLNVNQTKNINQKFIINSNNNMNINTYVVYKVFNIQLNKKELLNKHKIINFVIALPHEIVFEVNEN